ncbi:hypothetical protein FAUST_9026 [Fusarium austroamericanum]|uniref:DNA2/NAM7 helicase-like C-terminal domain-containing protein n=1 Tax=Fusarium austroamericanum TaxID=282268 RepID=A0AAN5Z3F8_FUSAU|nr:hypothetical protein FAUST_9026 [Fusarium austroamericanum]
MADPQPDQTGSRKKMRNYFKDCALLIGDCGPVFASGKSLCSNTKLEAQLGAFKPADEDPWIGIRIKIPLGEDQAANEASGFGVLHAHNYSQDTILANNQYVIQVRFPRDLKQTFGPVPDKVAALFPNTEALSYIIISLGDSKPTIFGYGRPYANAEDIKMQGWVNENKPIVGQTTLLDVLQLTEYHIVIPIKAAVAETNIIPDKLPPPFEFPYAIPEAWEPDTFKRDIAAGTSTMSRLFANREWLSLSFDAGNIEAERRVNATLDFRHDAQPSNPRAYGLPTDHETDAVSDNLTPDQRKTYDMVLDRMALHREVMRGSGFYHWLTSEPATSQSPKTQAPPSEPNHTATSLRTLPTINFLDTGNDAYANLIVEEALPEDRAPFRGYLSNRPLGLGIITAGAGFGKTTAGAAATLAMEAKVGKVLCSGPTNVAIDNFSCRLSYRSQAIVDRYNKGKGLAAGRELHPDDPVFVHELRDRIAQRNDLIPLSEFAQGKITCEEFTETFSQKQCMEAVEGFMSALVCNADFHCVTPAASQYHKSYREWKITAARAVAIDEAACMSRADLCCVWGNTLLSCFLFGDPRQLPSAVLTKSDTLTNTDHLVNRFSSYGKVSAVSALMASGLPVYRLKVQLRMVQGMFDLVSSVIYPDVPFTYHISRAATNPEFKVGHEIETYLGVKFPELGVPVDGALRPAFIHCEGSRVFQDPKTGSKRSRDQVKVGLDIIKGAVESLDIDPKDIVVISPYAANVKLINSMRRTYPALHALPDTATIDSFQGQESIITLVIMGTAHPRPGPGFTQNKQRLNVLLTRQKCALIIVGDINVGNPFRKGTKQPIFTVETTTGEMSFVKAPALRAVYRGLKEAGLVVTVNVKAETDNVSDTDTKS